MRKIIFALAVLIILAGCGPKIEPSAPECTLSKEIVCAGVAYDGSGFTLTLENTRTAEVTDISLKIEECPGTTQGSVAAEGTKTFGIQCPGKEGKFESGIVANYDILGTKYTRIGILKADMDYFK